MREASLNNRDLFYEKLGNISNVTEKRLLELFTQKHEGSRKSR